MKKMFIFVLVVFLTFILTGCGKEETEPIKTDGLGSLEEASTFKEIMVENIIVEDIIVENIIP